MDDKEHEKWLKDELLDDKTTSSGTSRGSFRWSSARFSPSADYVNWLDRLDHDLRLVRGVRGQGEDEEPMGDSGTKARSSVRPTKSSDSSPCKARGPKEATKEARNRYWLDEKWFCIHVESAVIGVLGTVIMLCFLGVISRFLAACL